MSECSPSRLSSPSRRWSGRRHQQDGCCSSDWSSGGGGAAPVPQAVDTSRPHLVNYGASRATTAVTFVPLPDRGSLVIGLPERGRPPHVAIEGAGVVAAHARLDTDAEGALLTPAPAGATTVDGIRCDAPTRLTGGSMLCLGRSNYFKYMCPAGYRPSAATATAATDVANANAVADDCVPMRATCPALDNPEYFHMTTESADPAPVDTPPPKPPRAPAVAAGAAATGGAGGAGSSPAAGFSAGEYLYTRLDRPPVPPPVSRGPPPGPPPAVPPGAATGRSGGAEVAVTAAAAAASGVSSISAPQGHLPASGYDNVPERRRGAPGRGGADASGGTMRQSERGRLTEEQLTLRHQQELEERQRLEQAHNLEQTRLEHILSMCAEYDSRSAAGGASGRAETAGVIGVATVAPAPRTPGSPAPGHSRIKTNGSLPRERRRGSPGCAPSDSEEEVSADAPTPPSAPPAAPPPALCSPYENVSWAACAHPHSPRTRIRTTLQREPSPPAAPAPAAPYQVPPVRTPPTTPCVYVIPPRLVPLPRPRADASATFATDEQRPPALRADTSATFAADEQRPPAPRADTSVTFAAEVERLSAPRADTSATCAADEERPPAPRSLQFENREYMRGLPGTPDEQFVNDDLYFLPAPAPGGGYVNAGLDLDAPDRRAPVAAPPSIAPDDDETASGGDWVDATERDREMCHRLKEQRRMSYRQLSELRQFKLELEHQESESIRQLEMEHALLEAEWEALAGRVQPLQSQLIDRRETLSRRTELWETSNAARQSETEQLAARVLAAEEELERLEQLSDQFRGTTDEETALLEKLKHQHELVELERKAHEDQEFHHMEGQVSWETEKEEALRVIHELETKINCTRNEMENVREQQRSLIESIRRDAEAMENQRREIVRQMCQERDQLRRTQRRLSGLSQSGMEEAADDPALEEPDLSSDTEETSNDYIASRLARLHQLGKSQDDLQRIRTVTSSSPLHVDAGGRCCSALREIERNRPLLLAKQGTQVIEEERRRLDELKRRVHDEVTAEWQQQRQLAAGAANSAVADHHADASDAAQCVTNGNGPPSARPHPPPTTNGQPPINGDLTVYPPITNVDASPSPTSDEDAPPPPITCGDTARRPVSDADGGAPPMSDDEPVAAPISDGEADVTRPRPVSEASSVFDGVEEPVRMRPSALAPRQRPLTRYMPITDEQFDLRSHIESAGHQLDLVPGVIVTRHSCRGYLHKQAGRLRGWQRRWFVFDRARSRRTFMYYADKTETKAKGGVFFQAIEEVYVDHLKTGRGHAANTTFCVKTMSRTFLLMAPSPEAMRIWVDVIMTGAEGHSAYSS